MQAQAVLDQFFIQDGQVETNGRTKRSVLLAIEKDFQYIIGLHKRWKDLGLSERQRAELDKFFPRLQMLRSFVPPLIY